MERNPEAYAGAVRAPEFPRALDWIGTQPIRLSDLRGKIVLLDFWTSGCINCMHILPNLHRLHEAFPNQLQIIGVHTPKFPAEHDPDRLAFVVRRLGIEHPVVSDPDYAIWQSFAVDAWPTLVFIDQWGRVIARHAGEFDYDRVHAFIAALLAEENAPVLPPGSGEERALERGKSAQPSPHPSSTPQLQFPSKITTNSDQSQLAIADTGNHRILLITPAGQVQSVIGTGEPGATDGDLRTATFRAPQGIAFAPDGASLIVCDTGNHLLRRVDIQTGAVSTIGGTGARGFPSHGGPAREVALASPWDVIWFEGRYLIAMAGTHQIWAFDPRSDRMDLVAGTGVESIHDDLFEQATFAQPCGIAALGHTVYVADAESSAIRALDFERGRVRRIVGRGLFHFGDLDAIGDSVRLQHPQGIVATEEEGAPALYLADTFNNKIKRVDPIRREVVTIAGTGEQGTSGGDSLDAEFREPSGLTLLGRTLYVADTHNHAIRTVDLQQDAVETLSLHW